MRLFSIRRLTAALLALTLLAAACAEDDPVAGDSADDPTTTTTTVSTADDDDTDDDDDAPATTYAATIRRTASNVPHVLADDLDSLGFGYGYAFAEDHACTLADMVVQVNSERAKYHGEGELPTDVVYAALDLLGTSRAEFDNLDSDVQGIIRGYAAGYNAHLEEVGADGYGGWCAGAEWIRPIDEYDLAAYYKALTLRASIDALIGMIFDAAPPSTDTAGGEGDESALAALTPDPATLGSNAWAIGPDRTADGTTMLVGNPHFPWQGALRFYELHLTVPGEIDVYGASLLGSPAVNIGFNENVAWSHTVSAGTRFTAYTLDLVDGDPTSYRYDDETREMTSKTVDIEVVDPDTGDIETVEHTVWFSHYGPVLAFPGLGWTEDLVISIRDANAENNEIIPQFLDMNRAGSMDDFIAAHEDNQGIPWVNTISASADGRIWYADTSATPNLSPEAIAAWETALDSDPLTQIAFDNRVFLLDGSDSLFEWVDDPGARDPGVVPFSAMPQLERTDFLFNANDPNWIANPAEPITGVSPLHGIPESQLSNRSRGNLTQLSIDNGDSGDDGLYTFEELAASAVGNRVFTAEMLADDVVARCNATAGLRAEVVEACELLADWDRRVNLDSVGAIIWREFIHTIGGAVWDQPFDPADPVGTPSGLAPAAADGTDAVIDALVTAVENIEASGFPLDAPLGDVQFADRNGERVPIHGGSGTEGVSNVVGFGSNSTSTERSIDRLPRVGDSGNLTTDGYSIANGTSFIYSLEFTPDGPVAQAFLTFGETGDPTSEFFADQTIRFSEKNWRSLSFTEDAIAADTELRSYDVAG